jgi:energy-coupling factor transport system substrate-specific component
LLNLSFWPFTVDPHSTIAYLPGAPLAVNVHRYLLFDATTSLGWDTGRAITNFVCILLVGSALLATFRRAARRAAFEAPTTFESTGTALPTSSGSRPGPDRPVGGHALR